ncbi:L-amino acid N-acyltransferase YncA [Stackebrandtia endophytica]|uniref:L-amino acid N-acyltransferase YncA n=1 Tax=Stackebrandtia endophytica TaxID=1496996 RepID=A0A543AVL4_9ACTN|nr:GNAT family N-acetyltransferase [Stackebrandtia endophytica]TQL76620.1 L-amino acid N-acyltransferase YncA [Stackebrandtia endophytica]
MTVDWVVRDATDADVSSIVRFGRAHIREHYAPLIGVRAAEEQVTKWWSPESIAGPVSAGLVVVAELDGRIVGVAQRGRSGADHAVYKLYVDPAVRGRGLGVVLLDAVIARLPVDASRLWIEHFAANERAGAFYEREGFTVERVEPHSGGDPALAVVWRSRDLST